MKIELHADGKKICFNILAETHNDRQLLNIFSKQCKDERFAILGESYECDHSAVTCMTIGTFPNG